MTTYLTIPEIALSLFSTEIFLQLSLFWIHDIFVVKKTLGSPYHSHTINTNYMYYITNCNKRWLFVRQIHGKHFIGEVGGSKHYQGRSRVVFMTDVQFSFANRFVSKHIVVDKMSSLSTFCRIPLRTIVHGHMLLLLSSVTTIAPRCPWRSIGIRQKTPFSVVENIISRSVN